MPFFYLSFAGSKMVLENFWWGPGKSGKSWIFLSVKSGNPVYMKLLFEWEEGLPLQQVQPAEALLQNFGSGTCCHYIDDIWHASSSYRIYSMLYEALEKTAQSILTGTANRHLRCCNGQLSSRIPRGVPRQAQSAIHQLRLNRLTSTASHQAFIGRITSPVCPHCGTGKETAEHLLVICPDWAAERRRCFGDSVDITDVFQDSDNLVESLQGICSPPHIGTAWRARHDNNNRCNVILCCVRQVAALFSLEVWDLWSLPVETCFCVRRAGSVMLLEFSSSVADQCQQVLIGLVYYTLCCVAYLLYFGGLVV